MRAAAVSLVVPATPNRIRSHLSPRAVIEAEGRYQVLDVERAGDRTVVTVWPNGRLLAPQYVFEDTPDGFVYRRAAEGQGLARVETRITLRPEGEETRVDIESTVERTLPVPMLEGAVARQRRRAVERLAARLDALVE